MEVDQARPRTTTGSSPGGRSWWWQVALAVVRHPSLWLVALGQVLRLAPPGWWRRRPFLPVPSADYLTFRLETMYGSGHAPEPADVVTYLRWCREYRHLT